MRGDSHTHRENTTVSKRQDDSMFEGLDPDNPSGWAAPDLSVTMETDTDERGEPVIYCYLAGSKLIAKRYAGQRWISVEPGYTVRGGEPGNYDRIEVEYRSIGARPQ